MITELSWVTRLPPSFDVSIVESLWMMAFQILFFKRVLDKSFLRENGKKNMVKYCLCEFVA